MVGLAVAVGTVLELVKAAVGTEGIIRVELGVALNAAMALDAFFRLNAGIEDKVLEKLN